MIKLERFPGRAHQCTRCPAMFVFARTVASERGKGGKAMPIDLIPVPDGNVAVNVEDPDHLRARVLAKDETHDVVTEVLGLAHFATCTGLAKNRQRVAPATQREA